MSEELRNADNKKNHLIKLLTIGAFVYVVLIVERVFVVNFSNLT